MDFALLDYILLNILFAYPVYLLLTEKHMLPIWSIVGLSGFINFTVPII